LATVTIHPMLFLDDGENLTPVTVTPIVIESARLDQIPEILRAGLAEQQRLLDEQAVTAAQPNTP
jgi:hypothetical protein